MSNNETAEKREAAIRKAARLLAAHLKIAPADDGLLAAANGLLAAHESQMVTVVEWRALSKAIKAREKAAGKGKAAVAETIGRRGTGAVTRTATVDERHWAPDDDYLVVEFQVFEEDGFRRGDEVEVTVEKTGKNIFEKASSPKTRTGA